MPIDQAREQNNSIVKGETKDEKLRLDFQPRFHADVCKGKLNHISRPTSRLLFHVAPLLNLFLTPNLFQTWRFLPLCNDFAKKSP